MALPKTDTLLANEVPEEFQEVGILSGYRRPQGSYKQCLLSLFYLHNETFNVWTHIVSFSFFVYYTYGISMKINLLHHEALLCLLLGCCLFPLGSAIAHLFNNMCPISRHVCFMIDYLAITIYAFGACIANEVYAFPVVWRGGQFERYFLTAMFVNCVITIIISCHTRFLPKTKETKIMRLMAFVYPYMTGMVPCMYRAIHCDSDNSCEAAYFYRQHFVTNLFTVMFYGGHIPEVLFPGRFDTFFHSHQIFHVVVIVATYHHVQGIVVDATHTPLTYGSDAQMGFSSPLLLLGFLTLINLFTVYRFALKMVRVKNDSKLEKKH